MSSRSITQELEDANPVRHSPARTSDAAWRDVQAAIAIPTTLTPRYRSRRAIAAYALGVAVAALIIAQVIPGSIGKPASASAAPFLERAARSVVHQRDIPPLGTQGAVIPQSNQFIYSVSEGPDGSITKTWLSVDGASPGLNQWSSSIAAPASGSIVQSPCTIADATTTGCYPEAGYFPDMPTNATALLAYLNQVGIINTTDVSSNLPPDWSANDIAKGVMYLMQTSYLLPTQQAAIFSLMAETPGFTVAANMADAIGRVGEGVEWQFEGSTGVLIFNPTTYAFLGDRTWPGPLDVDAPYDGSALIALSIVNSIPSN